jgi:hypothetical protein
MASTENSAPVTEAFVFLYKWIYGTSPFPLWFLVHAFWALHLVHRSGWQRRQTWRNRFSILISSWIITFFGRELLAIVLKKRSPIAREPLSLVLFGIIYLIFEFSPGNKVSDFCEKFCSIIAFFEGLVQFKLFTICLRNIRGSNPSSVLLFSLFFAGYDIAMEWVARLLLRFKPVPLTGFKYLVRTLTIFIVYWVVTRENAVTRLTRVNDVIPSAVVFGILHGITNAYYVLSAKRDEKPSPEKNLKSV